MHPRRIEALQEDIEAEGSGSRALSSPQWAGCSPAAGQSTQRHSGPGMGRPTTSPKTTLYSKAVSDQEHQPGKRGIAHRFRQGTHPSTAAAAQHSNRILIAALSQAINSHYEAFQRARPPATT